MSSASRRGLDEAQGTPSARAYAKLVYAQKKLATASARDTASSALRAMRHTTALSKDDVATKVQRAWRKRRAARLSAHYEKVARFDGPGRAGSGITGGVVGGVTGASFGGSRGVIGGSRTAIGGSSRSAIGGSSRSAIGGNSRSAIAKAPAPTVWTRHSDDTGDVWYANAAGETVWELPPGGVVAE